MRGFRLLLLATAIAAPATAQTPIRPRGGFVPPATAPSAPPAIARAVIPASPPSIGRLTLQGLPDRSDGAPICRAQCGRARAQCEATDDACAPVWMTCLRRCAAAR